MAKLTARQVGEIALHESAHCIGALRLGFDVKRVHIGAVPGGLGECVLVPGMAFDGADDDCIAANHALVSLCGPAAQRRLSSSEFNGEHQAHDIAAVADLILALDDADTEMALDGDAERRHLIENLQMYELLRTRADDIVRDNRDSIVKLARALTVRGELSGSDVRALIGV